VGDVAPGLEVGQLGLTRSIGVAKPTPVLASAPLPPVAI